MKPKTPSRSVVAAALAMLLAGGAGAAGYTIIRNERADIFESSVHQVVRVVDGDTIDIDDDIRLRLLGLDAPESNDCFYAESTAYLNELLLGQSIRIKKDISGADRHDRLLRYVFIPADDPAADDQFVNAMLLEGGYARVFHQAPDNQYQDYLANAEQEAREAGRGGWAACGWLDEYQSAHSTAATDSAPSDPQCLIKGNISEKAFGKNYFVPGCPNYNVIKISPEKGEAYFCTEEEAMAAGFARSESCSNHF